jgi:hypothetical protein
MSIPQDQQDPFGRKLGGRLRKRAKTTARRRAPVKPPSTGPPDEEMPLTLSVPEAGKKYFGLGRNSSYSAAANGDLPTVRIGRLLRVPVRALERMLDAATPKIEAAE